MFGSLLLLIYPSNNGFLNPFIRKVGMSQVNPEGSYNESFVLFFEGEIVGEADVIYRLAHAYTLNKEAAFQVVQQTLQGLIKDLPELVVSDSIGVRKRMFRDCLQQLQGVTGSDTDSSNIATFMKQFSAEERAALVMVELSGITVDECASLLEKEVSWVRKSMAKVRQQLVRFAG